MYKDEKRALYLLAIVHCCFVAKNQPILICPNGCTEQLFSYVLGMYKFGSAQSWCDNFSKMSPAVLPSEPN